MRAQFQDKRDLLRSFGYGEPDPHAAAWSAKTRPTLVVEGSLSPRVETDGPNKEREVHYFNLPFPAADLAALGGHPVGLTVTLSFFVEPNETGRQYAGAMLRWDMQGPLESAAQFRRRVNKKERLPGHSTDTSSYAWEIGPDTRSRGSVQSDRCTASAISLAGERLIAVYPTLGWWESRNERKSAIVPYSLVVTVDAGDAEVDLYTLIENLLPVVIET